MNLRVLLLLLIHLAPSPLRSTWPAPDPTLKRRADLSSLIPHPSSNMPLTHFDDGAMQGHITSILQDRRGLIWYGTRNGIYCYNGYDCLRYAHKADEPASLPDNFVRTLFQDSRGQLWIGTDKGVCRYRPATNDFETVRGINSQVTSIVEDNNKNIFCASGALYRFNEEKQQMQPVLMPDGKTVRRGIEVLAVDRNGQLWIGGRCGLSPLPTSPRRGGPYPLSLISHSSSGIPLRNAHVTALFIDSQNRVWAGLHGGILLCYDQHTGEAIPYETGNGMANNVVRAIAEDRQHRIWCGSEKGLIIIESQKSPEKLNTDDAVYAILCDRQGNVWIGSYFGGMSLYSPASPLSPLSPLPTSPRRGGVQGKAVRQMAEENETFLWIATENGGLNRLNRLTGHVEQIKIGGIASDNIHSLLIDKQRNLWIGAFMGGLTRYNLDTHQTETFNSRNSLLPGDNVFALYADGDGDIWIGTTDGLCRYDHADKSLHGIRIRSPRSLPSPSFIPHPSSLIQHAPSPLPEGTQPFVFFLAGDRQGNIWIGTRHNGLIRYNKRSRRAILFSASAKAGSLTDNFITGMQVTPDGLYIGTNNGGLLRYDVRSGRFHSYAATRQLGEDCIYALAQDRNHQLWITAGRNLYRLDTRTQTIDCPAENGNLPAGRYNYASALCDKQGTLWLGTTGGLVAFHPALIDTTPRFPDIQLTALTLATGEQRHVDPLQTIRLGHREASSLSIAYAAIQPHPTSTIVYQVRMEGVSDHWQYLGSQRTVNYTNLSPGTYRLSVRASSTIGVWSDRHIRTLTIVIAPPLYATTWAYLAYILLATGALAMLLRHRRQRQAERRRNYETRIENQKLEKLNQLKQNFLTDISHELKTPLSLIIAPARQMLQERYNRRGERREERGETPPLRGEVGRGLRADKETENLETILKGAQTLQILLKELAEVNSLNSERMPEMIQGNPMQLISGIARHFQPIADSKGIVYNMEIENWEEETGYSPASIEKIVNNLLSNAFKFTPEGGTIDIAAHLTATHINITVSDNGIGMSREQQARIFEKFYQANADGNKTQGWGVGLAIVKRLTDQLQGTIDVTSAPGEGSTFTVALPKSSTPGRGEGRGEREERRDPSPSGGGREGAERDGSSLPSPRDGASVLIVEDNPQMLRYLGNLFDEEYHVHTATDGREALDLMQAGQLPDIVVADVMMPRMSGTQLCHSIKSDLLTAHIPVILLTAKTGSKAAIEGYRLGADAYIEKPFDPAALLLRVKNMLKTRDNNRRLFKESASLDISIMANNRYDEKLLSDIRKIVEENIGNSDFCVNDICTGVGVSRTKLHVKLKSLINMSIGEYIKEMRIRKAKEMLLKGYTATETAYATGFSDANYFTKCFKKATGRLPREFVRGGV